MLTQKMIGICRHACMHEWPSYYFIVKREDWDRLDREFCEISMGAGPHLPNFDCYVDGSAKFMGAEIHRAL